MEIHNLLGLIGGVTSLSGFIPYAISTIKGKIQPNTATWLIWTIAGSILAATYFTEGDKNTLWVPITYVIGPLIIAILSIYYGVSEWSEIDKCCLMLSAISILIWLITKVAVVGLFINLLVDIIGFMPTLHKSIYIPESEDENAWFLFFVGNLLNVLAITTWNIASIYPVYLLLLSGSILVILFDGH